MGTRQDYLQQRFANVKNIKKHLEEAKKLSLETSKPGYYLVALNNIITAFSGISELSKKTGLSRTSLYKALTLNANPKIKTIFIIENFVNEIIEQQQYREKMKNLIIQMNYQSQENDSFGFLGREIITEEPKLSKEYTLEQDAA